MSVSLREPTATAAEAPAEARADTPTPAAAHSYIPATATGGDPAASGESARVRVPEVRDSSILTRGRRTTGASGNPGISNPGISNPGISNPTVSTSHPTLAASDPAIGASNPAVRTAGEFRLADERRRAILEAARAGRSPEGGPTLTRGEVEVLRLGEPAAAVDAILGSRAAEWEIHDASEEALPAAVEAAKLAWDAVDRAQDQLSGNNDVTTARTVLASRLALSRTLARRTGTPDPSSIVGLIDMHPDADTGRRSRPALPDATSTASRPGAPREEPNRLPVLLALVAAGVLAWFLWPARLKPPLEPPDAKQLSTALTLERVVVVGDQLHVQAPDLRQMEQAARQDEVARVCERTLALNFSGIVFLDGDGVVDKCFRNGNTGSGTGAER